MLTKFPGGLSVGSPALPDSHPAEKYLASLRNPQSQRTMRTALNNIAVLHGLKPAIRFGLDETGRERKQDVTYLNCDWAAFTPQQVAALQLYQPSTVNKILSALRGVLGTAYDLELMDANAYHRAVKVKGLPAEPKPAGRDLSDDDIKELVKVCKADKTPAGARDAAMLGIWYTCGIRRAELVRLELADFDPTLGKLTIRGSKIRRSRTVYVPKSALTALQVWLIIRGLEPGPLFWAINKAGKLLGKPMSAQAAYKRLKCRVAQAGVADFSPHDFRRTFVANLLDKGADIGTVAKLAGHASVTTTARYDRRAEEAKRKAAELLHFPF
jgi:site-specific recombinase XerD